MQLMPVYISASHAADILSLRLGGSAASRADQLEKDRLSECPELPYQLSRGEPHYYEHLVYEYVRLGLEDRVIVEVIAAFDFGGCRPVIQLVVNGEIFGLSVSQASSLASQIAAMAQELGAMPIEAILASFDRPEDKEAQQC